MKFGEDPLGNCSCMQNVRSAVSRLHWYWRALLISTMAPSKYNIAKKNVETAIIGF